MYALGNGFLTVFCSDHSVVASARPGDTAPRSVEHALRADRVLLQRVEGDAQTGRGEHIGFGRQCDRSDGPEKSECV